MAMKTSNTNRKGWARVRKEFSISELARRLGLKRQSVHQWGDDLPIEWVIPVEQATGIPRHDIAPETFTPPRKRKSA